MARNKKPLTLAEHDAELKASGKWDAFQAQQREQDAAHARRMEAFRQAEAPLVAELAMAGVSVDSVWDLVNTPNRYPASYRILLKHLGGPYPDAIREGIARALAVPEARFAWPILLKAYLQEIKPRTKDALAGALTNISDDEIVEHIIELIRDRRHGESRLLFLRALAASRKQSARAALEQAQSDPELQKEAAALLKRLKLLKP